MLTREQMNEIYAQIEASREQTKRGKEVIARADLVIEETRELIKKSDERIARSQALIKEIEEWLAK